MAKKDEVLEVVEKHPGNGARNLSRIVGFEVSVYLNMLHKEEKIERYRPDIKTPYRYWPIGICPHPIVAAEEEPPVEQKDNQDSKEQEQKEEQTIKNEASEEKVEEEEGGENEIDVHLRELTLLLVDQKNQNKRVEQQIESLQDEVAKLQEIIEKRQTLTQLQDKYGELQIEESRLKAQKEKLQADLTQQATE